MNSWLQLLSPMVSYRMPAGGDMMMDYKPWTNWGLSTLVGNPEIEASIFRDVALPGKQLGKLMEATMALIAIVKANEAKILDHHPEQAKALDALGELVSGIELKKEEMKKGAKAEALTALDNLKKTDLATYNELMTKLRAEAS